MDQVERKDDIYTKLSHIQNELKAPKNQYNSFGKYNYRNCEDILEAVKPICKKHRTTLVLTDSVELIGERYYIKSIARLQDWDSIEYVEGVAYARESKDKKGMDDSQVSGATSSYARKYALNGLFNIDDTKDFDTDESQRQQNNGKQQPAKQQINIQEEIKKRTSYLIELGVDFANQNTKNFIDKHNNGKHDVTNMNVNERLNYIQVLNKMIEIKEKEKKNDK